MKKIVLGLAILSSFSSIASVDKILIYNALGVKEEPMVAPRTQLRYEKSIGGLSCIKVNDISSDGETVSCTLNISEIDSAAIYDALDVEEVPMAAPRTQLRYQKSIGRLSCILVNDITSGNDIDCTLTF